VNIEQDKTPVCLLPEELRKGVPVGAMWRKPVCTQWGALPDDDDDDDDADDNDVVFQYFRDHSLLLL